MLGEIHTSTTSTLYNLNFAASAACFLLERRIAFIKGGAEELRTLLTDVRHRLKVAVGHPHWQSYVDYVNSLVS